MGDIFMSILRDICLAPSCIFGILVIWVFGVWLLTAYAWRQRIQKAGNNRNEIMAQNLLYIFGPFLLIPSLVLSLLAKMVPFLLAIGVVVAFVIASPFLLLYTLADYMPDIVRWILDRIGPFGEKILTFITRSPKMPIDSAIKSSSKASVVMETSLARSPSLRVLTRHSSRWMFNLFRVPRQSILLTAATNNDIPLNQRLNGVTGLTRLEDAQSLLQVACDPVSHIDVRVQAAEALEMLRKKEQAAQAWRALGRQKTDLVRRLDAADKLIHLGHPDTAQEILRDYLSHVYGAPKFHILAARLLACTGGEQSGAWRILKEYSEKRDLRLRLKAAAALCALERLDQPAETGQPEAAEILQNLIVDRHTSTTLRLTAAKTLEWYSCTESLEDLALQPGLDYHLKCKIILALERLGKIPMAAHAWQQMAQDTRAEPLQRIQAAEAFGRLSGAQEAHPILVRLAREPNMQPPHLLEIAQVLLNLGITSDANVLLRQLADGLISSDPVHKKARAILENERSNDYGEWLKIDQIGQ